jgi:hypothetical protein
LMTAMFTGAVHVTITPSLGLSTAGALLSEALIPKM